MTAKDLAKGLVRTANGDGQGGYSVRQLPPGTYSVTVDAAGFSGILSTGVLITVGGLVELPVTLAVAAGKEVVEVSSQAELVETSRSSTTDTIGQRRIDNLPINGRNYINFTLTDSQVVRDNAPNTGAAPTSGLNMSGQRARSIWSMSTAPTPPTIRSMACAPRSRRKRCRNFRSSPTVTLRNMGARREAWSTSLRDRVRTVFTAMSYGYLRNRNFQAVNPFSTVPDPAYTRVQAGVAFGGAIKKDKTFYYFAYEVTRRHETGFSSIGQDCLQSGGQTCFGLNPFDASAFFGAPAGSVNLQLTPDQIAFLANPAVDATVAVSPAYAGEVGQYLGLVGASSGMAVNGAWPVGLTGGYPGLGWISHQLHDAGKLLCAGFLPDADFADGKLSRV